MAAVLALAACGGSTTGRGPGPGLGSPGLTVDMNGSGYVSNTLATGTVAALPSDTLFARIDQVSGAQQPTRVSTPGIVYVLDGSVKVAGGGKTATLGKDQAAYLGPSAQLSTSDGSASFYFISVDTTARRNAASPFAGARNAYSTDDLPSLPTINQDEALVETTLQQRGWSQATRPNGVQVILDLGGTMDLSGGGANVHRLTAGQGAFVLQGSFVQVINRGEGVAAYLSFYLVSHGMALTVRA